MSKLGYRQEEPVDIVVPEEEPTLMKEILETYQSELS